MPRRFNHPMADDGVPPRADDSAEGTKASAAQDAEAGARMIFLRRLNMVLISIAVVALFLMLRKIDWQALSHSFAQVGPFWPLLFVPYAFTGCFWTISWRCLLVSKVGVPSLPRLFMIRLAGDSLNQLTPTASLGGEPFKAVRLHARGVAWQEATASLVIHKALMVLSLVVYIIFSLALLPVAVPEISHRLALFCSFGTMFLAALGIVFLIVQRHNPCLSLLKLLKRVGICPAVLAARETELAGLDSYLSAFYRNHPRAGFFAFTFYLLGWMAHAVEVFLIFRLLGHPIHFSVALCLDALAQLVAALGFMIPASFGVQDGGNIMLSLGFKLGATLGAGFSILRRFREAFWLLLGLLFVAREK